jgi:hypothetical protein
MVTRDSPLDEIKDFVRGCLSEMYDQDDPILERNSGRGVSERAIVFRFAHYLQLGLPDYFVDCDYNSSFEGYVTPDGRFFYTYKHGKPIEDENGKIVNRFVDVIVHTRIPSPENDFICFEVKKWNNTKRKDFAKDERNLKILSSKYGYIYGFHLIIHKTKS